MPNAICNMKIKHGYTSNPTAIMIHDHRILQTLANSISKMGTICEDACLNYDAYGFYSVIKM